jgi:hypothetical protein
LSTRARWPGLGLAFAIASASIGCGGRCDSSSDCDETEHCDLETKECIAGCTTNADCPASTFCRVEIGKCDVAQRPVYDAGLLDTGTSTISDAETSTSADAGLIDGG